MCRMDGLGLESLYSSHVKADLVMCYKILNNHPALCFSSSAIFLLVDACVGLNWLLVSFFLSHVNKNIIHSFIRV